MQIHTQDLRLRFFALQQRYVQQGFIADKSPDESDPATGLTRRQRDVLACLVNGESNKRAARTLGISEGAVKFHVAALFSRLGVASRAAAAVAGARLLDDD